MESSIRIDYVDRGEGAGVEPVIAVKLVNSDDPRDKLLKHLFQSPGEVFRVEYGYANGTTALLFKDGTLDPNFQHLDAPNSPVTKVNYE